MNIKSRQSEVNISRWRSMWLVDVLQEHLYESLITLLCRDNRAVIKSYQTYHIKYELVCCSRPFPHMHSSNYPFICVATYET